MASPNVQIYTAGAISWVNEQYAGWRAQIDDRLDGVTFLHPTETYNEYEGHRRAGCVTEDINMVEESDGVVALVSKPEQIGTVTEVVHAVTNGIPVLLLITTDQWDYDRDLELPYEIETPLEYHSSEYWFLVNYLLGDQPVDLPDGSTIRGWSGYEDSSAWITTRQTITDLAAAWIEAVLLERDETLP